MHKRSNHPITGGRRLIEPLPSLPLQQGAVKRGSAAR